MENLTNPERTESFMSEGVAHPSIIVSCCRLDQIGEFLGVLKNMKQVPIIKILLLTLLLCLLYKGPSKKLLVISLTDRQYFIADLKIDLLSSRAHPPTS